MNDDKHAHLPQLHCPKCGCRCVQIMEQMGTLQRDLDECAANAELEVAKMRSHAEAFAVEVANVLRSINQSRDGRASGVTVSFLESVLATYRARHPAPEVEGR